MGREYYVWLNNTGYLQMFGTNELELHRPNFLK